MTTLDTLRQLRAQASIDAKWYENMQYYNLPNWAKWQQLIDVAEQQYNNLTELINLIEQDGTKDGNADS